MLMFQHRTCLEKPAPWSGLGARCAELTATLKSSPLSVSEQLKLGLLPTIREFWVKKKKVLIKDEQLLGSLHAPEPPHLNQHGLICVGVRHGGWGVDEGHDAHPVVHQGHVRNHHAHDGLRAEEGG